MVGVIRTQFMLVSSSLFFGFCFWFAWSNNIPATTAVEIPLCFYNAIQTPTAPETVHVTLAGRQIDLLKLKPLAWHIDARTLQPGEQLLAPTVEQLFLPPSLKLVSCAPVVVKV